jgi:ATP-dependent Lhr-like helicase
VHALQRPSPFAFPLMVERFREKLTNEHLADRIARMLAQLHEAADAGGVPASPRVQDVVPPDPPLRPRKTPKVAKAPAEEQATAAVRRTLDFSLPASDSPEADAASRPRRVRKPSRPLPLL